MNKIYTKDEGQSFKSYWGDVTEKVKEIMGPGVEKAYIKLFECNPDNEPNAKQQAKNELAKLLSSRYKNQTLRCDAATVTVTLDNGHTFSFTNSEWGHIERAEQPDFT